MRRFRALKGLLALVVIATTALATVAPAYAAPNSVSITASNPTPGSTSNLTIGWSGYQTSTAVKCISAQFSGGYVPTSTFYNWDASAQGWSDAFGYGASILWDSSRSRSGAGSVQFTQNWTTHAANALGDAHGSFRDLSSGGNELSAWVYQPVSATGTYTAYIAIQNTSYAYIAGASVGLHAGQWTEVTSVPATTLLQNAGALAVGITSISGSGTNSFNVDDFQQGNSVGGYGGDKPQGMAVASATVSGTYAAGTWTTDTALVATGGLVFNNSGGGIPSGGSSSFTIGSVTEPSNSAGQTVFITLQTYSGSGSGSSGACGGIQLDANTVSAYATQPSTTVSVTVDPSLTFAVGSHTGSCNGIAQTAGVSSSANAVGLGHISPAANVVGAQDLTVTTNAGSGYEVYVFSSGSLSDGQGHSIAGVSGTNASPTSFPAAGTAAFGYTTSDSTLANAAPNRFTNPSANWAQLSSTASEISYNGSAITNDAVCVAYQVGVATNTAAAIYTATVIYLAVPTF